jgi:hypothetical protein
MSVQFNCPTKPSNERVRKKKKRFFLTDIVHEGGKKNQDIYNYKE